VLDLEATKYMPKLIVIDRSGAEKAIEATSGLSVMENLRDAGFDEVVALCGGCCSCATCHVYVERGPAEVRAPGSDDENDLLESSGHRRVDSRLSCQLILSDALGDLIVRIAPED